MLVERVVQYTVVEKVESEKRTGATCLKRPFGRTCSKIEKGGERREIVFRRDWEDKNHVHD